MRGVGIFCLFVIRYIIQLHPARSCLVPRPQALWSHVTLLNQHSFALRWGADSSSAAALVQRAVGFTLFFFPIPIADRRHPQQPTGYHAVPVALPFSFSPVHQKRDAKGKDNGIEHSILPAPGLTAPPFPQAPPTWVRTPFPPPSHLPSSRRGPRRRVFRFRGCRCALHSSWC